MRYIPSCFPALLHPLLPSTLSFLSGLSFVLLPFLRHTPCAPLMQGVLQELSVSLRFPLCLFALYSLALYSCPCSLLPFAFSSCVPSRLLPLPSRVTAFFALSLQAFRFPSVARLAPFADLLLFPPTCFCPLGVSPRVCSPVWLFPFLTGCWFPSCRCPPPCLFFFCCVLLPLHIFPPAQAPVPVLAPGPDPCSCFFPTAGIRRSAATLPLRPLSLPLTSCGQQFAFFSGCPRLPVPWSRPLAALWLDLGSGVRRGFFVTPAWRSSWAAGFRLSFAFPPLFSRRRAPAARGLPTWRRKVWLHLTFPLHLFRLPSPAVAGKLCFPSPAPPAPAGACLLFWARLARGFLPDAVGPGLAGAFSPSGSPCFLWSSLGRRLLPPVSCYRCWLSPLSRLPSLLLLRVPASPPVLLRTWSYLWSHSRLPPCPVILPHAVTGLLACSLAQFFPWPTACPPLFLSVVPKHRQAAPL